MKTETSEDGKRTTFILLATHLAIMFNRYPDFTYTGLNRYPDSRKIWISLIAKVIINLKAVRRSEEVIIKFTKEVENALQSWNRCRGNLY